MAGNQRKTGAALDAAPEPEMDEAESDDERAEPGRGDHGGDRGRPTEPAGPRPAGGSPFTVYKSGQGAYVRWGTAIGVGLIAVAGVFFLNEQLSRFAFSQITLQIVQTSVSVGLLVASAIAIYWAVGRNRGIVDFMIATEGEMKKVNWSSRREVIGATKVVIVTVLALGFILFFVDVLFMLFFSSIGILKVNVLRALFGSGAGS